VKALAAIVIPALGAIAAHARWPPGSAPVRIWFDDLEYTAARSVR